MSNINMDVINYLTQRAKVYDDTEAQVLLDSLITNAMLVTYSETGTEEGAYPPTNHLTSALQTLTLAIKTNGRKWTTATDDYVIQGQNHILEYIKQLRIPNERK